ncbi:MAG: response regulator [Acidobacteria bacterium]|nr:response regulator [Acidobacteriota bacterium]
MTTERLGDVIEALADLAWPLLASVVFWKLGPTILELARSRAFRVRVGMMEISVQDATEQLRRRVDDLQRRVGARNSGDAPGEVGRNSRPRSANRRVAWVDDVPENNAYEIARLQEDGVGVVEMLSTEDALGALVERRESVDVVISDMGRRENGVYKGQAGLELIRGLRACEYTGPIYVYCSVEAAGRWEEDARVAGAQGVIASPLELFEMLQREGVL